MAALSIRGARKSFGNVPVLHGVDLEVADAELAVFVGPSGCGKTTLLRLIAGLEDLGRGVIAIGGDVVNGTPASQRGVAIGGAIVREPKVLLFDEPLSNLDASLRVQMRIELGRLHKQFGTTMVYVTHDQVEAMTLGDRIAVFVSPYSMAAASSRWARRCRCDGNRPTGSWRASWARPA